MKQNNGFSIIELLISLTIFSLIIIVVYSSFYLGIKVWRKNEADLNAYQMIDFCFNRIRKDFGRIANHSSGFSGSYNEISFYILSKPEEYKTSEILEIKKVKYFLKNKGLIRQIVTSGENNDIPENFSKEGMLELAEDIKEIKFFYRPLNGGWSDQWTDKSFPAEVKMNLQLDDKIASKINNFTKIYSINLALPK